ncbi:MAG: hypothetical protein K8I00_03795, partial [Candidatus Omnitrophica bacterium]|nr:hypothetical protein [Candidatus Omnitrophota bacterium]
MRTAESLTGLLTVQNSPWGGQSFINILGQFDQPASLLWSINLTGSGTDGSTIAGNLAGINNSLEAYFYALYLRPDGNGFQAGYLVSSDITGDFDNSTIMFEGQGQVQATDVDFLTDLNGIDVETSARPAGKVGGDITGDTGDVTVTTITGQNIAIYQLGLGGMYFGAMLPLNWEARMGGSELAAPDPEIWVGRVIGSPWINGEFKGLIDGTSLSLNSLGTIHGHLLGTYDEVFFTSTWQGVSSMIVTYEPLTFSGTVSGKLGTINLGNFEENPNSSFSGLFGGVDELFTQNPGKITFLSEFLNPDNDFIWATSPLSTNMPPSLTGDTKDGGKFVGFLGMTGSRTDYATNGFFNAIYIRPDPTMPGEYLTGYLSSTDISGTYYAPNFNILEAAGNLMVSDGQPTTFSPNNISNIANTFDLRERQVSISGSNVSSGNRTLNFTNIKDQGWGIWTGLEDGELNQNLPLGPWQVSFGGVDMQSIILGSTNSTVVTQNSAIGETLGHYLDFTTYLKFHGHSLSQIEGSEWQTLHSGVVDEVHKLTSSGLTEQFIYNFSEQPLGNLLTGILGTTDNLFVNLGTDFVSLGFLAFGQTVPNTENFIWHYANEDFGRFISSSNGNNATYPDINDEIGSFYGITTGISDASNLRGLAYGFYINPQGNAGILSGSLTGFFNEIDSQHFYQLEGPLTLMPMVTANSYANDILKIDELLILQSLDTTNASAGDGQFLSGNGLVVDSFKANFWDFHTEEGFGIFNAALLGRFNPTDVSNIFNIDNISGTTVI